MTDEKTEDKKDHLFSAKEMFRIAKEARDLEIQMFWQRTNYFLLLNTAVFTGFMYSFSQKLSFIPAWFFCIIGLFICLAWIMVSLGSKYWQCHWEQVLIDLQEEVGFTKEHKKDYFSKETEKRVIKNLFERKKIPELSKYQYIGTKIKSCYKRIFLYQPFKCMKGLYKCGVLCKPSVSRWMHRTAVFFFMVWCFALYFVCSSTDSRTDSNTNSSMAEVCHTHTLSTAEAQCE